MKKYIAPEMEKINYNISDCLSDSQVTKNGEDNLGLNLGDGWEDDII